jgi:hypothetical protein
MAGRARLWNECAFNLLNDIVRAIRDTEDRAQLQAVTRAFADDLGCRYFAMMRAICSGRATGPNCWPQRSLSAKSGRRNCGRQGPWIPGAKADDPKLLLVAHQAMGAPHDPHH